MDWHDIKINQQQKSEVWESLWLDPMSCGVVGSLLTGSLIIMALYHTEVMPSI